ncbi:hypothetical protein, partial [Nonomuraea basaltis]|uniref:hypothetical protein n=1 Tax=Nonomuraea basaltis TaxID=2495887 RepID=UPI00197ED0D3
MPSHEVREIAGEGAELLEHFLVELVRSDVGRDLGQPLARRGFGVLLRPAEPGAGSRGTFLTPAAVVPRERARFPIAALTARATVIPWPALATRTPIVTETALTAGPTVTPGPAFATRGTVVAGHTLTTRSAVVTEPALAPGATIGVSALTTRTTVTVATL